MSLTLYVEGGGDSKELRSRCREGVSKLLEKAGFAGRLPRVVACGSRGNAYDSFEAATSLGTVSMLLIDSEDPITTDPWSHLRQHDGWKRPAGTIDDQAQLMVTCMETWLMADRLALRTFFQSCLQESAPLTVVGIESRTRQDVRAGLEQATRSCGRDKAYAKGKRSFQILSVVDPRQLRGLTYFQRFVDALDQYLPPGAQP